MGLSGGGYGGGSGQQPTRPRGSRVVQGNGSTWDWAAKYNEYAQKMRTNFPGSNPLSPQAWMQYQKGSPDSEYGGWWRQYRGQTGTTPTTPATPPGGMPPGGAPPGTTPAPPRGGTEPNPYERWFGDPGPPGGGMGVGGGGGIGSPTDGGTGATRTVTGTAVAPRVPPPTNPYVDPRKPKDQLS